MTTFAFLLTVAAKNSSAQPQASSGEQEQIVDTVKTVFAAALVGDLAKFHSVVAPGFYIFDGGGRFDGDAIMTLIKEQQAAGKRFEWNVADPDVHVNGDTAWIAYVNRGSITDASGRKSQEWLESAFLQKQAGSWKIVFMHSTRVPAKPPESPAK